VAASSFGMKITDPKPFLDAIDQTRLKEILGQSLVHSPKNGPIYVEPGQGSSVPPAEPSPDYQPDVSSGDEKVPAGNTLDSTTSVPSSGMPDIRRGKVQRLGDFIDTDAVSTFVGTIPFARRC
jgi:hypothetical protein